MDDLSRRSFLKRGSVAVAMAGAATAMPALTEVLSGPSAAETGAAASTEIPEGATLSEPVVAHLRDLTSGEVHLFVGSQQVVVNDPQLAHALFRATR